MSYSATQLAKKLDISRSYLYYLKDNGVVEVEINDNGRVIWNEQAYQKLSEYIKKNKVGSSVEYKDAPKEYKTTKTSEYVELLSTLGKNEKERFSNNF